MMKIQKYPTSGAQVLRDNCIIMDRSKYIILAAFIMSLSCCDETDKNDTLAVMDEKEAYFFTLTNPRKTNLYFTNKVYVTQEYNYLEYESFYNGSGVAIGDINNDGLPDIYFGGNSVSDKLYLNKGDLKFEDITKSSGIGDVPDGWSTGINMVDINADGYLDIYVCRGGPYKDSATRINKLYINNGDLTFTEQAASYGLNNNSYSIQTAFFDYDLDGDLDMYLMNQPPPSFQMETLNYEKLRADISSGRLQTDLFYENIENKFVEKTGEAGLVNFGYRLGIAVGDINQDGYPDLYVCSDYDEADLMYMNLGNKSFKNSIHDQIGHISFSSMGIELVDINNDGLLDIYVVEMAPDDHFRAKNEMFPMSTSRFLDLVKHGFHHQYMYNTLQLNNGNGSFSEIAELAGLSKSDWSWAPLFFDIDNDGMKDLFISNGVKHQFIFGDFTVGLQKKAEELNRNLSAAEITDLSITEVTHNNLYRYTGDLKYEKVTESWMDESYFNSNGVAYGDLDNDGDLDLVINNMDKNASLYENNSANGLGGNFIKFKLTGPDKNRFAIGSKIIIKKGSEILYQELHNARGYLSSVDHSIIFGLGDMDTISEAEIIWPDGKSTFIRNYPANKMYAFNYDDATESKNSNQSDIDHDFQKIDSKTIGITYQHRENSFNDFRNQVLLPYSQSHNGPFISKADVNGDGLDDFFVGGAANQSGELYIQQASGEFVKQDGPWSGDKAYEDLGTLFFDFDNDGDQDLYVVSGGSEFKEGSNMFQDRLYANNDKGLFSITKNTLPAIHTSGQTIITNDIDKDGDLDIFIGGRIIPDKYPYSPHSHLLLNESGRFVDITSKNAPDLEQIGMVTDAIFIDFDEDGDDDLIVVGEWTPIQFLENKNGVFKKITIQGLENSVGIWFSIAASDIDNDGDLDFFAGNLGLNSKFKAGSGQSFHIYCDDFDNSGSYDIVLSNIYKNELVPVRGRECSSQQIPLITIQFPTFKSFAEANLSEIYGQERLNNALHYEADLLESVFIENLGNGLFKIINLPVEAQLSPIHDFKFIDIDDDGVNEVLAVGNNYNTETETMRLDASYGCILKYENKKFSSLKSKISGFSSKGDARDMCLIETGENQQLLLVTNNDAALNVFKVVKEERE